MYKVEPTNRGKYNNIELGARYFLFKKDALECFKTFLNDGAEPKIYKFTRLYFGAYAWSDGEMTDYVIDMIYKDILKEEE